jgi:hypothetical protein
MADEEATTRHQNLARFYWLLECLEERCGGKRHLSELTCFRDWPQRGVYFFFERTERRLNSGEAYRVVRIGTHALTASSRSSLQQRLQNHRGHSSGGGNHRGSIFRLLVGQALISSSVVENCRSWGFKGDLGAAAASLGVNVSLLKDAEYALELAVSAYIRDMPFLWLNIDDAPGPNSMRGVIERNSIALLSNLDRPALDGPSDCWLGRHSDRSFVRNSGLWNQRHTKERHNPGFLNLLENLILNG